MKTKPKPNLPGATELQELMKLISGTQLHSCAYLPLQFNIAFKIPVY